jgi:hypothetical protein
LGRGPQGRNPNRLHASRRAAGSGEGQVT